MKMRSKYRKITVVESFILGLSVFVISSCGVPVETTSRPIPDGAISTGPASQRPSPQSSPVSLWFVKDQGLVKIESEGQKPSAPDEFLRALVVGPSESKKNKGLRTVAGDPLAGATLLSYVGNTESEISSVPNFDEVVKIQISPAFSVLPPSEQILLLGQVVLTLTSAGWPAVEVVDESGTPVAVPLPNGRLLDRPVIATDYLSLELHS